MTVIIVSSVSVIEAVDATDSEQLTTPPQSTDQVQSSHSTLFQTQLIIHTSLLGQEFIRTKLLTTN